MTATACHTGLTGLETLHMDDCEGVGDWAFLRPLQRLTSLSWTNRFGGRNWFASEAELEDLPRASGLVQQALCLKKLQRWVCVQG